MGYQVIIAEKPSVAAEIAKIVGARSSHREGPCGYVEGNGYRVTWAFGHLVGLKTPEQMGFDSTTLPMFPDKWETKIIGKRQSDGTDKVDPGVAKQMKTLKELFGGADKIIVATDAGREGELIFRYIYEYLNCKTEFYRLWISSLTDEAIRKGLNEIKHGSKYNALSDAAHARSEADWLVGYNASRALRVATGFKGRISLGRVQTPTLGMICDRYEQFKNFVPVPYWQIQVNTVKGSNAFAVLSEQKFDTEEAATEALKNTEQAGQLKVDKVEKKRSTTKPPLLYDLTALQRAANSKYGLTADETLKIAQKLYEAKLLSYPRTGSRYIPEDVYRTLPELIAKFEGYDRFGNSAKALKGKKLCHKSVNDAKVTDHHALLPTGNDPSSLSGDEKKIFDLVCGRMLEAFGEDFIADVTNVLLSAGGITYKAHGSTPVYMGWKGVFGKDNTDENSGKDDDEDDNISLPELNEGEPLPIDSAKKIRKETKPQPIYDDNSLLGEMETCGKKIDDEEMREAMKDVGLGTPATRAATIETLITRGYIAREKKKLIPTDFGLKVWHMVKGRKIADVKTTGEWERDLALVEHGQKDVAVFNDGIKDFVTEIISDLKANCQSLEGISSTNEPERKCPCCGRIMRNLKYNILCDTESGGCGYKVPREILSKKLPANVIEQLCAGKPTGIIKGFTSPKTGKKFDAKIVPDLAERKLSFAFDDPEPRPEMKGRICPFCGKEMTDNKVKLSCECGFELWKTICKVTLTEKQMDEILSGQTAKVFGMTGKKGKFDAGLVLNRETKKLDFDFSSNGPAKTKKKFTGKYKKK